jgi:ABC-type Co2+ transport system permease subunit
MGIEYVLGIIAGIAIGIAIGRKKRTSTEKEKRMAKLAVLSGVLLLVAGIAVFFVVG